jgi:hypothetical protein
MAHVFVYWIRINVSCITCFNFWKHTQTSKLDGGLVVCLMIMGQGSDPWNTQLMFECLLGNGGHACFNHS